MTKLANKVSIVTGAAQGIGLATALIKRNAIVVLMGIELMKMIWSAPP